MVRLWDGVVAAAVVDEPAALPVVALPRQRARRVRETPEVAAAAGRMIRAVGVRAGTDVDALVLLVELRAEVDRALVEGVAAARAFGWSWNDVGRVTGMRRQSAQERWGRPAGPA